jgi:hypothetical protein
MKKIFKYLPLLAVAFTMVACQNDDEENFDNKAYINASTMSSETIIKGEAGTINKTLTIVTSRPAEKTISAKAVVDKSLLATYNMAYYAEAQLLPDSCYEVVESNMTIDKGSVKSTAASFNFMKLGSLDRAITYVLPVNVQTSDIDMIASEKTYYYVFKAGALINVVADIEKNYLQIYPWSASTLHRVEYMNQITMEALVYPRDMSKLISTVMGIEGAFLMRLGDAGILGNQLQIATAFGNFTDAKLQIDPNKWSHLAMTYDENTRELKVYINGHLMASATKSWNVDIVGNGSDRNFMVGKSYDDTRYLTGCISEVRVWDVIRTADEIANNIYSVDPTSAGLIAYWKFDDQSSFTVKDYSGNGNDLTANSALAWKNVSLPAK